MMKHVYARTTKLWYTVHNQHKMRKQDIIVIVVRNSNLVLLNEVKECCKGHTTLSQRVRSEDACVIRIGKRHATRLMSDAYGRGIVRGQVKSTNLRAYHKD
jgi:hypothetical protein